MVDFYYPQRFHQIMKSPDNRKRARAYAAIKISQIDEVDILVKKIDSAYPKALKKAEKLQAKINDQKAKLEEAENAEETNANRNKADKAKANLQELKAQYKDFFKTEMADIVDWWYEIMDYHEVLARTNRRTQRMVMMYWNPPNMPDAKRPLFATDLVSQLQQGHEQWENWKSEYQKLKESGNLGPLAYDAARLIGDKKVVERMIEIHESIIEAKRNFEKDAATENSGYSEAKVEKAKRRAVKRLEEYKLLIRELADLFNKAGGMRVGDFNAAIEDMLNEITKHHGKAFSALDDKLLKVDASIEIEDMLDKLDEVLFTLEDEHVDVMLSANNKEERLEHAAYFHNTRKNSLISKLNGIKVETEKISNAQMAISKVHDLMSKFLPEWEDFDKKFSKFASDYVELFNAAPNDLIQLGRLIHNPPEYRPSTGAYDVQDSIYEPYIEWFNDMIILAEDWVDFARMFIGVKSMFRTTIAFRSAFIGGKDPDNVKYVDAMNALLNDALSGKSLSRRQIELIDAAKSFYPRVPKIDVVYKMVHLIDRRPMI